MLAAAGARRGVSAARGAARASAAPGCSRRTGLAARRPAKRDLAGGPDAVPFARSRAPNSRVHEEHELVWDDGVAAETALDFDASHISSGLGLAMWLGGFGFFAAVGAAVWASDPEDLNLVNRGRGTQAMYDGLGNLTEYGKAGCKDADDAHGADDAGEDEE